MKLSCMAGLVCRVRSTKSCHPGWRTAGCLLVWRCCASAVPAPGVNESLEIPPEALVSTRKYRKFKNDVYRRNRSDPELEKKARYNELFLPLDEMKTEWQSPRGRGLHQLRTMALHSNIYQDVYRATFFPQGFMDVFYSDVHRVTWGHVIQAKHAQTPPTVLLPPRLYSVSPWGSWVGQRHPKYPEVKFVSLVLSNPDGHLLDSSQELLHWMVANVPVKETNFNSCRLPTESHVVIPYLPPVPPSGTGVHRFVFTLYTHTRPLETTPTWSDAVPEDWLQQRKFSTSQFLADNMAADKGLRPFTFSYFQSYWDTSVRHIFKHVLKYPEPVYGIEKKLGPRKTKQNIVRAVRQAIYRDL